MRVVNQVRVKFLKLVEFNKSSLIPKPFLGQIFPAFISNITLALSTFFLLPVLQHSLVPLFSSERATVIIIASEKSLWTVDSWTNTRRFSPLNRASWRWQWIWLNYILKFSRLSTAPEESSTDSTKLSKSARMREFPSADLSEGSNISESSVLTLILSYRCGGKLIHTLCPLTCLIVTVGKSSQ